MANEAAELPWPQAKSPLLQGLSVREVNLFATLCSDRIYLEREVIFDERHPSRGVFLLNRGCVRISARIPTGSNGNGGNGEHTKEKIVEFLKSGEVFGEATLTPSKTLLFGATAHQDCWTSFISQQDFLRLVERQPQLALNCIKLLGHKVVDAYVEITSYSTLSTEERVANTLLRLARDHGSPIPDKRYTKLGITVSHEILADLIGRNRPLVSTIMSDFNKRGWIHYQRKELQIDVRQVAAHFDTNGSP